MKTKEQDLKEFLKRMKKKDEMILKQTKLASIINKKEKEKKKLMSIDWCKEYEKGKDLHNQYVKKEVERKNAKKELEKIKKKIKKTEMEKTEVEQAKENSKSNVQKRTK
jgi:hypothetical protein